MNLIFLSLVPQSQAGVEEMKFAADIASDVGKGLMKLWNKCTPKEAPADGQMCHCFTQGEQAIYCNSKQICRDGGCVENKAVRKKCTSLDRCVEGQGQCTGSHSCWGDLICGEQSCGAVRKEKFQEEDGALFEQGYVADVKDPTVMHENNHCCCVKGKDGCTERTSPLLHNENCEKTGKCEDPYVCKQAYIGLMWTCQFETKEKEDEYKALTSSGTEAPIKRLISLFRGAQIQEGQIDYQQGHTKDDQKLETGQEAGHSYK